MKTKKKSLVLVAVLAVIGLACVIGGISYALFNYYKKGTIENDITTGKLTFRYDETGVKGIDLKNAVPILDSEGISLSKDGEYFDFTVSTKGNTKAMNYTILTEVLDSSTLPAETIKLYLTEIKDGKEEYAREQRDIRNPYGACSINKNGTIKTYTDYNDSDENNEKEICNGYFDASTDTQTKTYRLRAWIDKNTDFSPEKNEDGTYKEDSDGNYIYKYNNKTIKIRVNVKATASNYEIGGGLGDFAPSCSRNPNGVFQCDAGSNIILPDGSKWLVISDYTTGDETISLLSTKYIDENGDFSDTQIDYSPSNSTDESILNSMLETYSNKIKTVLPNTSVTVSLPSASMLGISDFDPNTDDTYFYDNCDKYRNTQYNRCSGKYVLSDKKGKYGIHWWVNNNDLTFGQVLVNSGVAYASYQSIKPVISIPASYFEANYSYTNYNNTIK